MVRTTRLRTFIKNFKNWPPAEKLSFIPPFIVLLFELLLLLHELLLREKDVVVISLVSILIAISVIEVLLVSYEINEHYKRERFEKTLAIKLDDFIIERKRNNLKSIVKDFIHKYPEYNDYRREVYQTACQIMKIHKERAKELDKKR